MASGKKFYKRPKFMTLIIALLIAAVAVPKTLALTEHRAKKLDVQVEGERAWGQAVEGVQVRLRAKGATTAKRVTLLVDARNDGPGKYRGTRSTHGCWLKVDGKWYGRVQTRESVAPMLLKAGDRQLAFTQIRLSSEKSHLWRGGFITLYGQVPSLGAREIHQSEPLELSPGRHTVRLAFPASRKAYAYSNTVEIEILPAEEKPAVQVEAEEIEKTDSLVWGKEVNGLRAAVEFVPEKGSYEQGEVVGIRFHLQNVSNQIINLATPRWWIRSRCFAEDQLGIKMTARTVPEPWGMTTIDRHKLLPGRVIKLESGSLAIAKDETQRNSLCKYPVRNVVTLKPGRYSLYYWLRFPGITRLDGDGKVIVPQPDDWQGALETGKRKLVLTSTSETDQKPTVQVEAEEVWGEPVEGVQVRLRAEKATWQTGEWPGFRADLRNHGERKLYRSGAPECWEIELDGLWYHPTVTYIGTVGTWPLFPRKEQTNILVPLHKHLKWQSRQGKQPLEFRVGKHTVRVALRLSSADGGQFVSVVSNPVEIQITPDGQEDQSWGKAVDGIQVRLRPDKRIWNEGDDPSFKVDMRNNGTRELETCLIASIALEVDGKAYAPRIWFQLCTIGVFPFGPGSEYTIKSSCSNFSLNGKGAEELTPGKHTIRAVYLDNRDDSGIHTSLENYGKIALAFSNPVGIEILPADSDMKVEVKRSPDEDHVIWGEIVDGLQVGISLKRKVYYLNVNDPEPVHWQIKNTSQEDKAILWQETDYSPVFFEIGKTDEKKHLTDGRLFNWGYPKKPEKILLRPGEVKKATFDLRFFRLWYGTDPITYEITGLYSPGDNHNLRLWLEDKQQEYKDVVMSRISSGPVQIITMRDALTNPDVQVEAEEGYVEAVEDAKTSQARNVEPRAKSDGKQDSPLQKFIRQYSKQKIVRLDIGEQYTFRSHNGIEKLIRLASVKDYRDKVVRMVRRAEVVVVVNGRTVRLVCQPYTMPTVIDGLRIQADTTSGWRNINKRVQLSIWDANDPIVDTGKFCFPIKRYLLFSHGLQAYNEVRHLGLRDGDPGHTAYHDYGIDLGGYNGGEEIVSPVDGRVIEIWPSGDKASSVVVGNDDGLLFSLSHLDSILPSLQEGNRVEKGGKIGMLGKKGASGNFSHLHLGTWLSISALKEKKRCRNLNLYPWLVTTYQAQYGGHLYAIARPHQVVLTGEEVIFDGLKSLAYDAKIVDYQWEFDNGQVVHTVKAGKVFDKPGVYVGTLRVRDEQGNEDVDFCRVKVFTRDAREDNIATIYMTHTPTLGISEGQEVLFQFWIQGGKEERISIDFGDGATLSDYVSYQEVRHKFDRQGIYIITATANVNGLPIMGKQRVVVESTAGCYLPADSFY